MIRQISSHSPASSHNKSKYDLIGDVLITTQSNNYLYIASAFIIMGKKGKKGQAGKPKKLTPKDIGKRLDALVKKLEEELEGVDLFSPLPPTEDCAICLVPLYRLSSVETLYKACCGKAICWACHEENKAAVNKRNEEKSAGKKVPFTCPFCRKPEPTVGPEYKRQLQARCLLNDHIAFKLMGNLYQRGSRRTPKHDLKALDCYMRAAELGSSEACGRIGSSYLVGCGVAVNKERSALFAKVGALRGCVMARHNIGWAEYHIFGNHEIAIRHWKISAEAGYQNSLNKLRGIYNANGKKPGKEFISKESLDFAYRACHWAQMEVKSEEREKYRSKISTESMC